MSLQYDRRTAKIARYADEVRDGRKGVPISIQVALTDACYNRCIMCDHPSRPINTMPVEPWLHTLDELSMRGLESVCYSGGDPMAYRAFNKVMDYHVVRILSFGMTITGAVPAWVDLELLAQAKWVRVSLDAVTPAVYERVRGKIPVSTVIDGIERMMAAGVNVCLGITVHSENEADVPNVLAYAASMGITDIDTRPAYPDSMPNQPLITLDARGVRSFQRCHAALYQLYINADGSVFPCCVTAGDTRGSSQGTALGNIFTDQWKMIWSHVVNYSRIPVLHLPSICRTSCVPRLSEINQVCDVLPTGPSFF